MSQWAEIASIALIPASNGKHCYGVGVQIRRLLVQLCTYRSLVAEKRTGEKVLLHTYIYIYDIYVKFVPLF